MKTRCGYFVSLLFRPKLHSTDTGYGHVVQHHQRTPPTDELRTILQQICHIAMPEPNISTCQDVGMWQIFVRWWRICCTTSRRIVVSSSAGGVRSRGVRSRCPCSGVRHFIEMILLLFRMQHLLSMVNRILLCLIHIYNCEHVLCTVCAKMDCIVRTAAFIIVALNNALECVVMHAQHDCRPPLYDKRQNF